MVIADIFTYKTRLPVNLANSCSETSLVEPVLQCRIDKGAFLQLHQPPGLALVVYVKVMLVLSCLCVGCVCLKCEYAAVVTDCSICPLSRLRTRTVIQILLHRRHTTVQELVRRGTMSAITSYSIDL